MTRNTQFKLIPIALILSAAVPGLAWSQTPPASPNSPSTPSTPSTPSSSSSSSSSSHSSEYDHPDSSQAIQTRQSESDQQSRQVVRQISSLISSRISSNINPSFSAPATVTPIGGSGDGNSWMPDSLWSSLSWTRLSSNGNTYGRYNADIYQTTTGVDKNFGNWYFGATLNYAGTTNHINTVYGSNHTVGVTPYAAYVFNKNFFISGLTGYNYSANNYRGVSPDSEMDSYVSEIDLNGLYVLGNWFFKGKTGGRYLHSYTRTDAFSSGFPVATRSNLDSWTYLIDVEGGYNFSTGLRAYNSVLFENTSPSSGTVGGVNYNIGNNIFYYTIGADYAVTKKFTLGAKGQTDLNNSVSNLTTITLNARLTFD